MRRQVTKYFWKWSYHLTMSLAKMEKIQNCLDGRLSTVDKIVVKTTFKVLIIDTNITIFTLLKYISEDMLLFTCRTQSRYVCTSVLDVQSWYMGCTIMWYENVLWYFIITCDDHKSTVISQSFIVWYWYDYKITTDQDMINGQLLQYRE